MSAVLLVRHGQASFGESDYDALSDLGARQSRVLGQALAARGVEPAVLLCGTMQRHRQTLEHVAEAAGWITTPTEVDNGWDEFDHEQVIELHQPAYRSQTMKADPTSTLTERQAFQEMFEAATTRWSAGEHDEEYTESYPVFGHRVQEALRRTSSMAESKQAVVVFTSGGPVSRVCASILDPFEKCGPQLWGRLNVVTINTAVTKIVIGGRGQTLVSVNDHSHLEAYEPGLVTYR
ncbi:MAG: histidine phosphatase family protein [Actinomycetota bacterium]|nr:histidine phosphatase family protein [Actinomycetota bacterium]